LTVLACTQRQSETGATLQTTAAMTPVQRGDYLATIMGCHDCHTPGAFYGAPNFKRILAGSEIGWQGPWGVSYASNLTPDPGTGIGSYTDAEIERALRSGVRKNGSPMMPPMPWPNIARLSPEDMAALIAYLRSIPPVIHKNVPPVPPGHAATGAVVTLPSPPAWDAPVVAQ
jgi:mono/diheme cytochrome c family protein